MVDLSTNAKGAIAEAMIVAEAVRLGVRVLRPVVDGTRYDLALTSAAIASSGCSASGAA